MQASDLPWVVEADHAAFVPLWRNSLGALQRAFAQAILATVAQDEHGVIVGYQLSTGNPSGAHLARLAVRPEAQGLGVGGALAGDLLQRLRQRGPARLTVNTQDDNQVSLLLYEKLGFVRTGETFPVFIDQI
jgi:ribosomal protein S18 acetylase RimI-like enzyme